MKAINHRDTETQLEASKPCLCVSVVNYSSVTFNCATHSAFNFIVFKPYVIVRISKRAT